jgi:hypothetical protein
MALVSALAVLGLVGSAGGAPASTHENLTAPTATSWQRGPDLETSGTAALRSQATPRSLYPASYFAGPLGRRNPLPPRRGAWLLSWHGRHGWPAVKAGVLARHRAMGRSFDGIATVFVPTQRRERWIHRQGALPIIAGWTPGGSPHEIAAGQRDRAIIAFARHLKRYPFVVMVRMFHEFDQGHVSYHACGEAFVAMWRRVVTVVQEHGAHNVGFWWSPSEGYDRECSTASYPGDAYVDWVGADAYNHCFVAEEHCYSTPYRPGWAEFSELFDYERGFANLTTQHDRFGPRKPFVIGETGTVYDPGSPSKKGDWYRNISAAAKNMTYLRGIMFFDADVSGAEGARNNWHVDHPFADPTVYDGYVDLARDPWFNTRR